MVPLIMWFICFVALLWYQSYHFLCLFRRFHLPLVNQLHQFLPPVCSHAFYHPRLQFWQPRLHHWKNIWGCHFHTVVQKWHPYFFLRQCNCDDIFGDRQWCWNFIELFTGYIVARFQLYNMVTILDIWVSLRQIALWVHSTMVLILSKYLCVWSYAPNFNLQIILEVHGGTGHGIPWTLCLK